MECLPGSIFSAVKDGGTEKGTEGGREGKREEGGSARQRGSRYAG